MNQGEGALRLPPLFMCDICRNLPKRLDFQLKKEDYDVFFNASKIKFCHLISFKLLSEYCFII